MDDRVWHHWCARDLEHVLKFAGCICLRRMNGCYRMTTKSGGMVIPGKLKQYAILTLTCGSRFLAWRLPSNTMSTKAAGSGRRARSMRVSRRYRRRWTTPPWVTWSLCGMELQRECGHCDSAPHACRRGQRCIHGDRGEFGRSRF